LEFMPILKTKKSGQVALFENSATAESTIFE
jgi:hypothetical protein